VTEQKVTVVNVFSRYEIPWNALAEIGVCDHLEERR
jgi:hypothetical protein